MIRYLKYIFLIFGTLALLIIGFFVFQNKEDLSLVMEFRSKLSYDTVSENCPDAQGSYYFPCFKPVFEEFTSKGSLTAIGFGLKMAFNFMDDDKESTTLFPTQKQKDVAYALDYLELNNIAIAASNKSFKGFDNMYGGYLSSLREFLEGAKKFSDNLIAGLEGEDGIAAIEDKSAKAMFSERFKIVKSEYDRVYTQVREFTENEIEAFLEKAEGGEK